MTDRRMACNEAASGGDCVGSPRWVVVAWVKRDPRWVQGSRAAESAAGPAEGC